MFFFLIACPNIMGIVGYISAQNYVINDPNIFSHTALDWGNYSLARATLQDNDSTHYIAANLKLDASKSNAIYGNSSTVQPSSINLNILIKF